MGVWEGGVRPLRMRLAGPTGLPARVASNLIVWARRSGSVSKELQAPRRGQGTAANQIGTMTRRRQRGWDQAREAPLTNSP